MLLRQSSDDFEQRWINSHTKVAVSGSTLDPAQVSALGTALRELDTLRQEGLISELEFEQKRRLLLDRVA